MILPPKNRPPTPPGQLLQRFLDDYDLTQSRLAELTAMQLQRVNQIMNAKRSVTPDTALRLARLFGTTADLWLNAQLAWDLWHAARAAGTEIEKTVQPLAVAGSGKVRSRTRARTTVFSSAHEAARSARLTRRTQKASSAESS